MVSSMRFKTFAEAVDEGRTAVKGQTTIKVVTSEGEEPVLTVFTDEKTGEFVLVTKPSLPDDVDSESPRQLSRWRAKKNGAAEAAKEPKRRGRPPGSKNKPKDEASPKKSSKKASIDRKKRSKVKRAR